MTETDSGDVTRPVLVMVVIPATVERLMPAPAAKLPLILPVMVDAEIVLALMTLTDKGDVTRPVLVMVVIPATVERLIPAPAAKLPLILPVMVDAVRDEIFAMLEFRVMTLPTNILATQALFVLMFVVLELRVRILAFGDTLSVDIDAVPPQVKIDNAVM
jgi:hypothetical protein